MLLTMSPLTDLPCIYTKFHSDAEKGLGPNVASLSLGASAHMYFRLHSQYAATELPPGSSRSVLQLYLRHVSFS